MRLIFVFLLGLGATLTATAQTFPIDYRRAVQARDTAKARKVLAAWYAKEPQNPEWYVAKFNYQLQQAYRVVVSQAPPAGGGMAIEKKGQPAGSLDEGYEPQGMEAARATLREGIRLAPDRLDMRFGLATTYEMVHDAPQEVAVLTAALADHQASGKPWRWKEGKPLPEPEAVFWPKNLEEYMLPYWQADTPADSEVARQLAELIRQYYPKSALGYFNLGMYHVMAQAPDKAYGFFQQAQALQPNDWQTLANLTKLAIGLNRKTEAQHYLELLQRIPAGRPAAAALGKELRQLK